MAEIKSTLDIVLEKTKHLTLSAEEKAEMQLKDALKKIAGYVKRVIDRLLSAEELLGQIRALPQEQHELVQREIARQMSQELDLSERTDPLIAALEVFAEPAWTALLADVRKCRYEYREARDGARQEECSRLLAGLATKGIRGSAVLPKVEDAPSWQAEDNRLRQPCEERLAAMREALSS